MPHKLLTELPTERALRQALEQNEFVLHYQRQVDVKKTIRGFEALIRWNHPIHGLIGPAQFIGIAEDNPQLISAIGDWVLRESMKVLRSWSSDPVRCRWLMSVNVSGVQFKDPLFEERLESLILLYEIDPQRLRLEITETTRLSQIDAIVNRIHKIRALGFSVALDDFGTGHSFMGYLNELPIDEIKLAGVLLNGLGNNEKTVVILKALRNLGIELGVEVVVEGVETEFEFRALTQIGFRYFQGYLFGLPGPTPE